MKKELKWVYPKSLEEYDLPTFPANRLTTPLENFFNAVAEDTQTPVDMAGVAVLTIISICVQGKYEIEIKESWKEPLNLYSVIIANPAERKSPVLNQVVSSVYEFEQEQNDKLKQLVTLYQHKKDCIEGEIALIKKSKNAVNRFSEIENKQRDLDKLEIHRYIQLVSDDSTPEELVTLLSQNNEKMAVISAEGGIFDMINGRYNSGKVNLDVYLKAHDGDALTVNRRGRMEKLRKPLIAMLLAVQPQVLNGLINDKAFRGRGLTARFLYVYPNSLLGKRKIVTTKIPYEIKEEYKNLCYSLLAMPNAEKAVPLKLSYEAHCVSNQYAQQIEEKIGNDLYYMQDWVGKLHGTMIRIAGILHVSKYLNKSHEIEVSSETMESAVLLGNYFLEHAKKAFDMMGSDYQMADARYVLRQLQTQTNMEIKRYVLFRMCRGRFKKTSDMDFAVQILIKHGYIVAHKPEEKGGSVGRPQSEVYILNPMYF